MGTVDAGGAEEFLFMIRPIRVAMLTEGPTSEEETVLTDHFSYLKDLTDRGVVELAGRTLNSDETSFGTVILRADSEEAAREIMNGDPVVKRGVMRAELYPYRIALRRCGCGCDSNK